MTLVAIKSVARAIREAHPRKRELNRGERTLTVLADLVAKQFGVSSLSHLSLSLFRSLSLFLSLSLSLFQAASLSREAAALGSADIRRFLSTRA